LKQGIWTSLCAYMHIQDFMKSNLKISNLLF
jgi:hypothetical protein